jgi:hypothetical protein
MASPLSCIAVALLAFQPAVPAWRFHDAAARDGRSLLTFRAVELGDRPVRPLAESERPTAKALFSLLAVGSSPEHYLALVWLPEAGQVWIDSDGDGRFAPAERHRLGAGPLEVPVVLRVGKQGVEPARVKRTMVLRRTADGGLRYAVRGYVTGALRLDGQDYAALLTDGNADGCFDSAAHDRVWLDLDRDGRFDPLTEQFPLGKPVAVGGKTWLVKPEPDGSAVQARARPSAVGKLRVSLTDREDAVSQAVSIDLVSDWGELVTVTAAKDAASLPVARYAVEAVRFQLTDPRGRRWRYHFAGPRRFDIEVTSGREKVVSLLSGLCLAVALKPATGKVHPGDEVYVTPTLRTPAGLYVVNCEQSPGGSDDFVSGHADIRLANTRGDVLAREESGFL